MVISLQLSGVNYLLIMFKNLRALLVTSLIGLSLIIGSSCKHSTPAPIVVPQNTITLNAANHSLQDTFYVSRTQTSAVLQVIAMANPYATANSPGSFPSRLYIYTRSIDNPTNPTAYVNYNYSGSGFLQDTIGQYYYSVPNTNDTTSFTITMPLRANNINAVMDEFYFVYTSDHTFKGPLNTSQGNLENIIFGPAQFFVEYGKLTEYGGLHIYNPYTTVVTYHPAYDIIGNYSEFYSAPSDSLDIATVPNPNNSLFTGKISSAPGNGTMYVRDTFFPYATATDTDVMNRYNALIANATTSPPDSMRTGDIYLMYLRNGQATSKYACMKIIYVYPEDGLQGVGHDNEYIIFNVKK